MLVKAPELILSRLFKIVIVNYLFIFLAIQTEIISILLAIRTIFFMNTPLRFTFVSFFHIIDPTILITSICCIVKWHWYTMLLVCIKVILDRGGIRKLINIHYGFLFRNKILFKQKFLIISFIFFKNIIEINLVTC